MDPSFTLPENPPATPSPTDLTGLARPVRSETVPAPRAYWQAQGLAELTLSEFQAATEHADREGQRRAFYLLANYYGRTIYILRTALAERKEPLAQAALRNLIVMHRPLAQMHQAAPHTVPLTLTLEREHRDELVRDLIVRVLAESPEPLSVASISERVNDLDLLGMVAEGTVRRHLRDLIASGHAVSTEGAYARTGRTYSEEGLDALSLHALTGTDLYAQFAAAGFHGLRDVDARQSLFRRQFPTLVGLGDVTASLFIEAVRTLLDVRAKEVSPWRHADLIGSPYPRPYQYEAYAVFRGHGYQGQVIESPTGSGKTMIGMMCIQDWLRTLRPGQSVLVLVPTANYQQQWIGELCYKPIGLRISPDVVFSGTPAQLERFQRRTGEHPAILLLTYTALAQTGSAVGKGGFDVDSIEMFLQGANVQYVILDEVHKVVEDMTSVSAEVTRQLVAWLRDGSLRGLIGFSGTAEAYRPRFAELGLELVYTIPMDDLIAYGFVAPFAEFGLPFANSARERRIRDLLDDYKGHLREYFDLLGGAQLRRWFAEVPLAERFAIGQDILGMYRGRADLEEVLTKRLTGWEKGGAIAIPDAALVTILQIARGWPDTELVQQAGADPARFAAIAQALEGIRQELCSLIYLPRPMARLQASGFTTGLDVEAVRRLPTEVKSATARADQVKDLLATTITGLYDGLSDWYMRVGEGRVETIKAVIEAERSVRPVGGIIVFDTGRRIRWREGVVAPGYEGVGGLFAQMLGDPRFTAFAALSSEMYLTYDEADPLPPHIAKFIEDELIRGEVGEALFGLTTMGLDLPAATLAGLQKQFASLLDAYIPRLADLRAPRPSDFARRVLRPLRRTIRGANLGQASERLLARLDLRNIHLTGLIHTFFDYAALAANFRRARVAELEQVSGAHQKFFVVPMPSGPRKQLMYDLTARIVDAETLPLNLVIVSNWARTGWNVVKPNVLVDATATRDVVAWQQLRGRAMRALRTWTNDCYRLILVLAGSRTLDFTERADLPEDITRAFQEAAAAAGVGTALDERLRALLDEVTPPGLRAKIASEGLTALSDEERNSLAVALMLARNKVTHIYELVKAFGATIQIEYNRPAKVWQRRENIALKHEFEIAVQPFTGELLRGAGHAPLLYAKDPRIDLPADLQRRVGQAITGQDEGIVAGWLRKEVTGSYQPPTKQPAEVVLATSTEQTTGTSPA